MIGGLEYVLKFVNGFFLVYLMIYASYLLLAVGVGAWQLYYENKMRRIKNEIKHDFYFPVSILVPAYNEEITIVDNVESLLRLDYRLYEIIIVDDGSSDNTVKELVDHFKMRRVHRPIRKRLDCAKEKEVYRADGLKVPFTLICKENGEKETP